MTRLWRAFVHTKRSLLSPKLCIQSRYRPVLISHLKRTHTSHRHHTLLPTIRSILPSFGRHRHRTSASKRLCTTNHTDIDEDSQTTEHDLTFLDQIFQTQWSTSRQVMDHLRNEIIYDVILLNAPGDVLIKKVCNHATSIVCADGGANSLFRAGLSGINIVPNAIVGDLDSVEQHILDYFISKGSKKVLIEDQNDNDFHKALAYLLEQQTGSNYIICWGAFGERFDHEMQGFNVLCKFKLNYAELYPEKRIMLMTGNNFAMVLKPGRHLIKCARLQGPVCSMIPLYQKTTVSTKGLKWNMNKQLMEFGGLVSSSNGFIDKQHVEIETDQLMVFHTSCNVKVEYADWNW